MKLRLAWLGDSEYGNSYSSRECRVLLRALARRSDLIAMWFAMGSAEKPHLWNNIHVYPVPMEAAAWPDYLRMLIGQSHPDLIISNLARSASPAAFEFLAQLRMPWIHRLNPADQDAGWMPPASLVLIG